MHSLRVTNNIANFFKQLITMDCRVVLNRARLQRPTNKLTRGVNKTICVQMQCVESGEADEEWVWFV